MAYCPKCGVELENYINNCPLCHFEIPDIGEGQPEDQDIHRKYPSAVNIYQEDYMVIKNKIFFSFLVVAISVIIILAVLKLIYPNSAMYANYAMRALIALLFYVYFAFWYLKPAVNILGILLTTLFLTYSIDHQDLKIEWFTTYALPIVLILYVDITVFMLLYKMSRNKNKFVYIPTFCLILAIILCIGIDGVVTINLYGSIKLSWSIIVLISGGAMIFILLGIYHGVPEKGKAWLKRKLHV